MTLTVATPGSGPPAPLEVPDVTGMAWKSARDFLQSAGFEVELMNHWQCTPPELCEATADTVWHQEPGAGVKADPGSTVKIRVNRDDPG